MLGLRVCLIGILGCVISLFMLGSARATERLVYEAFPAPGSEVEETGNLYIKNGSEAPEPLELWGQNPTLDTRGRLIAYYHDHRIFVTDFKGRTVREVFNLGMYSYAAKPQWVPGKGLVFDGSGNILVADYGQVSGHPRFSEVNWPGRQWAPAASPDGEKIAFLSENTPSGEELEWPAVYLTNLDGSSPVRISDSEDSPVGAPTFSRDGNSLIYSTFGEFNEWEEGDLVSVTLGTGEHQQLTSIPGGMAWDPHALPDGRIVFTEEFWSKPALEFLSVPENGGEVQTIGSPFTEGEWGFHISGRAPVSWEPLTAESQNLATHLLYLYAPTLKYDSSEKFRAVSVTSILETYSGLEPADSNRLIDEEENVIQYANLHLNPLELRIWFAGQGKEYLTDPRLADASDRLDERNTGSFSEDAAPWQENPEYADISYGRAVYTEGHWWLQYWFWYYYDEFNLIGAAGDHEGDWEMIQIQLGEYGNPQLTTYAQHHDETADTCNFDILDWTVGAVPNISPVVYPAYGRHASYIRPGSGLGGIPYDEVDGEGYVARTRAVDMFEEVSPELLPGVVGGDYSRNWSIWPGRWGNSLEEGKSPMAPISQGQKWDEPGAFAEQAESCPREEEGTPQGRVNTRRAISGRSPASPRITAHLRQHSVDVRYALAQRSPQRQLGISVSVLARRKLVVPTGKTIWGRDHGRITLKLPAGQGPYTVIAKTVRPNGLESKETLAHLGTQPSEQPQKVERIAPSRTSVGPEELYGLRLAHYRGLGSRGMIRHRKRLIMALDRRLRAEPLPNVVHATVDRCNPGLAKADESNCRRGNTQCGCPSTSLELSRLGL